MSDWILNRWTRYGQDRLYAEATDGTRLGYLDMRTYELHPTNPSDLPQLSAAIAAYLNQVDPNGDTQTMYFPRHDPGDWTDAVTTQRAAALPDQFPVERSATPIHAALARVFGVPVEDFAWSMGADAEESLPDQLAGLGTGWSVIDAVPVGVNGANLDHLVIGPGGVFTIDANSHPNSSVWVDGEAFLVNGTPTHYIPNSRHEGAWTSALLSAQVGRPVDVTAIIAVSDAHGSLTVKEQPWDGTVVVLGRAKVGSYLKSRRPVLTFAEVDALTHLARRSTTWRPAIA